MLSLRVGDKPQAVVTTTPKPIPIVRSLIKQSEGPDARYVVTRDTSYANRAFLSDDWWKSVVVPLEGTRQYRQEIEAEVVDDVPGAQWRYSLIEATRISQADFNAIGDANLGRVVIGVDPAVTSSANSNETGIVVVAAGTGAKKGHSYVIRDASGRYGASEWTKHVVAQYHALKADCVIAEVNNGGDLVEYALRVADPNIRFKAVHAAKGKRTRAEPVVGLYEQTGCTMLGRSGRSRTK